MPHYLVISNENLFNCWKTLKIIILQRKDEISLNVNVTKVEKNNYMIYGVNLSIEKWAISSQVPNRKRFNDYP